MTTKPNTQRHFAEMRQALNAVEFQPIKEQSLRIEIVTAAKLLRDSDRQNTPDQIAQLQDLIAKLSEATKQPLVCPKCGQEVATHEA